MPTKKKKTWSLLDCAQEHKKHPDMFDVPSSSALSSLKVGDCVKLIFEPLKADANLTGERMWVQLTRVPPVGWRGRLDNVPVFIKGLHMGALIEFESRHVADVYRIVS